MAADREDPLLEQEWSLMDRFVAFLFQESLDDEDCHETARSKQGRLEESCKSVRAAEPSTPRPPGLSPDGTPEVVEGTAIGGRCDTCSTTLSRAKQPELRPGSSFTPKSKLGERSVSGLSEASTIVGGSPCSSKPRVYGRSETDLSEAATVLESSISSSNLLHLDSDEEGSPDSTVCDSAEPSLDISSEQSEARAGDEDDDSKPVKIATDKDGEPAQRAERKYEDGVWGMVSMRWLGDRLLPQSTPELPLPPCHFELLTPTAAQQQAGSRTKVLLLHGWMQDSSSWRPVADGLLAGGRHDVPPHPPPRRAPRLTQGVQVLLLDFYGHGRSPGLLPPHVLCKDTLVRQVWEVVDRCGWRGERLCVGGCSLGGAVACHLALQRPAAVASVVLVAAAGLSEPSAPAPAPETSNPKPKLETRNPKPET